MLDKNKVTRTLIVSPGSEYVETKLLNRKLIYVPISAKGKTINKARAKSLNENHINKLTESFKNNGIDYSKNLPIVVEKKQWVDGVFYEYELIAGAHRFEAFRKLDINEWLFDIYQFGIDGIAKDLARSSLQIRENDHTPELPNTAIDLINIVSYLINKKLLKNTEYEIGNYLHDNSKNLHSSTMAKVIRGAVATNGAYQDIKTYPSEQLSEFLASNPENQNYAWGGEFDAERDKFGWTVLEGYENEYVTNALKRLDETGKGSYFIMHTKAPTEKRGLKLRRKSQIGAVTQLERGIEKAYKFREKNGEWPWNIEAFLAQDVKNKEKTFLTKEEI